MPIIDVTCSPRVDETSRRLLADLLPDIVSRAVACRDEPYDGHLQPGDVMIRFRDVRPDDRFDLDVVVEIHSKWTEDRAVDRQGRVERVTDEVARALPADHLVGVLLNLPVAAWAQSA